MKTFFEGNRVRYVGRIWKELDGVEGTVIAIRAANNYRVRMDKSYRGWSEFTMMAESLELVDPEEKTVRAQVLDEAKRITATDRNSSYGEPEDNFQRIADLWNVFLQDKLAINLTPGDTAALMILVKMAREMNAPSEDNKVDIAGYAACWAEVHAKAKLFTTGSTK